MIIKIETERQMAAFGLAIGKILEAGDLIGLTGDLGAGKTTLTKAIAHGMGIEDYITSPTFTIVNEYEGRLPLYHFDVYRISDEEEMFDIGYEEYFFAKAACVVEWANLIPSLMPEETLWLDLRLGTENPEQRLIHLTYETHWAKRVEHLLKELEL
jgi:tRNA threonylcarbamoyladenosine biosynthesis protein TsaE